jgi:hypothetical protein
MALTKELKREGSLTSLRNGVFRLERNLRSVKEDKAGVLNIDSNGDTITISQKFIFEELNQIAESKTLERDEYIPVRELREDHDS